MPYEVNCAEPRIVPYAECVIVRAEPTLMGERSCRNCPGGPSVPPEDLIGTKTLQ